MTNITVSLSRGEANAGAKPSRVQEVTSHGAAFIHTEILDLACESRLRSLSLPLVLYRPLTQSAETRLQLCGETLIKD